MCVLIKFGMVIIGFIICLICVVEKCFCRLVNILMVIICLLFIIRLFCLIIIRWLFDIGFFVGSCFSGNNWVNGLIKWSIVRYFYS